MTEKIFDGLREYGADVDSAMERFINDKELYYECLQSFLNDDSFVSLESAIDGGTYEEAFMIAHTLKGVTGNLGLTPLYNEICVLVELLRSKQYENLKEEHNKVMCQMERLIRVFEQNGMIKH